jgi:hypothetical protein
MKRIMRVILILASAGALVYLAVPDASAAVPTITSFTPTSGSAGCAVTITGTSFTNPPVTTVQFNGTIAATFTVISDTQLEATVPPGATTGPISVVNADGTASSATSFTVVASGGGCAPAPGSSPIQVFTNTEPEICAVVGTNGETAMPTPVTVGAPSRLVVYFTSERSGFDTHTELLLTFELLAADSVVASTPFEWGNLGVALRGHTSGTVMWTFDDVSPGEYRVRVGARVDPLPGSLGGSHPTAALENCALTVFAISSGA